MKTLKIKNNYNITFSNSEGVIGILDFNESKMKFEGNVDESAKLFFDFIAKSFSNRLLEERERCAELCDNADKSIHPADLADEIRKLK